MKNCVCMEIARKLAVQWAVSFICEKCKLFRGGIILWTLENSLLPTTARSCCAKTSRTSSGEMRRKLLRFSSLFREIRSLKTFKVFRLSCRRLQSQLIHHIKHTYIAQANGWSSGIGKHTVNKSVTSRHAAAATAAAAREKKNFREEKKSTQCSHSTAAGCQQKKAESRSLASFKCVLEIRMIFSPSCTHEPWPRTFLFGRKHCWLSVVHLDHLHHLCTPSVICSMKIIHFSYCVSSQSSLCTLDMIYKSVKRANCQPLYSSHKQQKRTLKLKTTASRAQPAAKVTRLIKKSN